MEGLLYPEKLLNSRNRPGQEPLSAESIAAFKNQPPGAVWVWGGPPAGWACVSAPAARATSRRTPVLTTAKPAQEEPSRVSLRKHRISPALL